MNWRVAAGVAIGFVCIISVCAVVAFAAVTYGRWILWVFMAALVTAGSLAAGRQAAEGEG